MTKTFNIERLREAVAWAEFEAKQENPKWYQPIWAQGQKGRKRRPKTYKGKAVDEWFNDNNLVEVKCASGMCIAGWVCAGEKDSFIAFEWSARSDGALTADYVVPKGSREMFRIDARAADLLGISQRDADALFEGGNTLKDIKRIARRIAKKHGEVL